MSVKQLVGRGDFGGSSEPQVLFVKTPLITHAPEKLTARFPPQTLVKLGSMVDVSLFFQGEKHFRVTLVFGGCR